MSSRTARNLVITAPDGTDVIRRTSGGYDTAGIIQNENGSWSLVANGWSHESVYNRTHARYNRGTYKAMHVGSLHEQTAPGIRAYFGGHAVRITQVFQPGTGWSEMKLNAGTAELRRLVKTGITAIAVQGLSGDKSGHVADFQMDEILRSMRPGKAA